MVLLTHHRISLGRFLCLSGLFCQRLVVYPTTFSADTTASTYDLDYAFFFLFYFLSFHFFFYFLVSLKRCCNHAHLFLKISSYLRCCHLKGIHSRSDTNRTGAEGLSFYYPKLLHCLNQMLAVMSLSQHCVLSSKTVRPRTPCGARCIGHTVSTWSAVSSEAPHSQFGEGARPHLCMGEWNCPTPVRSSYLDCMPQRLSFCGLFLFLFCFLLLTNFLFHYVFYGGTEIKDTDTVMKFQF